MIPEAILVFFVIGFFSYVSNIPPGFVNIKVVETSLFKGYWNGVKMAGGAAIAELTYCALAVITSIYLQAFPQLFYGINVFVVVLLLTLAFFYFRGKSYAEKIEESKIILKNEESSTRKNYFLKGAGLGFLNPQMFPYWFIFYSTMQPIYKIQHQSSYFFFVLGAILGGFGLLWTYAFYASKYREKIFIIFGRYSIHKYVGWMFIGMAVIKIIDLIQKYPPGS